MNFIIEYRVLFLTKDKPKEGKMKVKNRLTKIDAMVSLEKYFQKQYGKKFKKLECIKVEEDNPIMDFLKGFGLKK